MKILPPTCEAQLKARALALAGKTLGNIAAQHDWRVPSSLLHAKGWIGQLIEQALGAQAANLDLPDFIDLGIELKTIPITPLGRVCESTYICTASIPPTDRCWEESRVWRKMAKILWIPIETGAHIPLFARRIGCPILWSASPYDKNQLQQDWEELTDYLTLGEFTKLNAYRGQYLQIRPKAPHSRIQIPVLDHEGQNVSTGPKGFYLRTTFTQKIILPG